MQSNAIQCILIYVANPRIRHQFFLPSGKNGEKPPCWLFCWQAPPHTGLGGVEGPASVRRARAQVVVVLLTLAAEAGLAGLQAAAAATAEEGGARVEGVASSSEPSAPLSSFVLVVLLAERSDASLDWVEASSS